MCMPPIQTLDELAERQPIVRKSELVNRDGLYDGEELVQQPRRGFASDHRTELQMLHECGEARGG